MPKAYLAFNLPTEQHEFDCAQQGGSLSSAIYDLDNWLRHLAKYENKEIVKIDDVRRKLREFLTDKDITVVE